MAEFRLDAIADALTEVSESGVSISGKAINLKTEVEAADLIQAINDCSELVYLDLEGNTLGVDAALAIANALKKHPELKKALWRDLFTGRLKTEIPQALKHMGKGIIAAGAQLTVLDCSDNALGPNGMVGLVGLIKSTSCYSLQELKLNNCGLGITGGKMLANALLDCHAASLKAGKPLALKVFVAGRNRIENDAAIALAEVFSALTTLEEISMPQNGIYHVGISALSKSFKLNPNMQNLNLNDNTIGPKGSVALADAFYSMQNLKSINFGDCLLKTKGCMVLSEALQDLHTELECLNFGYNEINADGGMAVATAMHNKTKLKTLTLNGNQFGDEGCSQLLEILAMYKKSETLGSLSEDDSTDGEENDAQSVDSNEKETEYDDDDDDAYEDINDDDEDDGGEDDAESTNNDATKSLHSSVDESGHNNSVVFVNEEERPKTVESFCYVPFPNVQMLYGIPEKNKIQAFRDYLKTIPSEHYLTILAFTILKCSALSTESKEALDLSQALFKDCFEYVVKNNQIFRIKHFLLIQLGLMKIEDKNFKPQYNQKACRYAMEQALKLEEMPSDLRMTMRLFLDRFQTK